MNSSQICESLSQIASITRSVVERTRQPDNLSTTKVTELGKPENRPLVGTLDAFAFTCQKLCDKIMNHTSIISVPGTDFLFAMLQAAHDQLTWIFMVTGEGNVVMIYPEGPSRALLVDKETWLRSLKRALCPDTQNEWSRRLGQLSLQYITVWLNILSVLVESAVSPRPTEYLGLSGESLISLLLEDEHAMRRQSEINGLADPLDWFAESRQSYNDKNILATVLEQVWTVPAVEHQLVHRHRLNSSQQQRFPEDMWLSQQALIKENEALRLSLLVLHQEFWDDRVLYGPEDLQTLINDIKDKVLAEMKQKIPSQDHIFNTDRGRTHLEQAVPRSISQRLLHSRGYTQETGPSPAYSNMARSVGPSPAYSSHVRSVGPSPAWSNFARSVGPSPAWSDIIRPDTPRRPG